jgi:hypothetical protein
MNELIGSQVNNDFNAVENNFSLGGKPNVQEIDE